MAVVLRHSRRRIYAAAKHSLVWPTVDCHVNLDSYPILNHQPRFILRSYQIAAASQGLSTPSSLCSALVSQHQLIGERVKKTGGWSSPCSPVRYRSSPVSTSASRQKEGAQSASESSEQADDGRMSKVDPLRVDGEDPQGSQASAKSQAEDTGRVADGTDSVTWTDVSMEHPSPSLSAILSGIVRNVQRPVYVRLHQALFEKSFDLEEFLEGSKVAYSVVHELFGTGNFEDLESLVCPPLLTSLKSIHGAATSKLETEGFELALYDVEKEERKFELDKMEQREDYDRELYFRLLVSVEATIRVVKKNKAGEVVEKTRRKVAHSLTLARQMPFIPRFFHPVEVIESPWVVLEMSDIQVL